MTRHTWKRDVGAAAELISALRSTLRGDVIAPSDLEYDAARAVWNGIIDRRPVAIARCADTADVVAAVRTVRERMLRVSIRGGGHQVAGSGVCDDGLVIDLSAMRKVEVDPDRRIARAQGGVLWGEFDRATQRHGLVANGGEVSTTGIAGFTLGGGMGLTMRAFGLACDHLRSVEIVTADGVVRRASRDVNPDLFWAVRGGGRGIGVVTSFEFELHPLGPDVAFAQVIYHFRDAERILRAWPNVALAAPETVTPQLLIWTIPPDPAFPEELHNERVLVAVGLFAGPPAEADEALAPLRTLAPPALDASATAPYLEIQSSFDDVFPAGGRYYMKSHFMDELSDKAIATYLDWDAKPDNPGALIAIRTMGGAVARVGTDESAYPHRSARFNFSIDPGWTDPGMDAGAIGWARGVWDALRPHATGGVYINFSGFGEEEESLGGATFGISQQRLAAVRAKYDPDGLFEEASLRP
jgi:FAD/FMN-containing dehydrogenase